MTREFTLSLADPRATLENVGGKGASLARLAGWGLPVPDGFHLTCEAYRDFVADNGLEPAILDALDAADPSQPSSFETASSAISGLFAGAPMSSEIARAIAGAYARLPGGAAVAVRSSATAEDLPGMSFAGQQETYLNVRGEEELLGAVVRCWASLWTARAIAYRLRMGVDQRSVSMGVVVQIMVPSEVSGVLFTADPTTGEQGEMVINASYGLGEAVVSGRVTPDTLVVDKTSLIVKKATLGMKDVSIRATGEQGTVTEGIPEGRRGQPALSERSVKELGKLALQVERESGGVPQDLEWAVADGRYWILQARPMTGLPPAPLKDVRWDPPIPGTKWIRRQVAENMPEPLSPLFEELYLSDGMELAMQMDMEMLGYPGVVANTGLPSYATVNGYAYMCASFTINARGLLKLLASLLGGKTMRATFVQAIPYWRDEVLPGHLKTVERWKELDLAFARDEQLLDGIRELALSEARYWGSTTLALAAAKGSDMLLGRFLAIAMPRSGLSSSLFLRGFPSKALEAQARLEAIAEHIRASGDLRQIALSIPVQRLLDALSAGGGDVAEQLQDYLGRYGHQVYNLDFADPTQDEDPTPVLLSLKAEVHHPGVEVRVRQAEMVRDRESLVEQTARHLDPLRRRLFLKILHWAQGFAPYREETLFYIGSAWPALRRLALELGRRLAEAGSLDAPGDVFYLQTQELLTASEGRRAGRNCPDLARIAMERRGLREARKRLHPPAAVPPAARWKFGRIDLSGFETQKRNADEGPTLQGFPVSPGRVTAPASVILSPADFDKMMPGTILVCPTTIPAWTPLFAQAKGLVTDIGGVAAHGSIVAREYGIPAVMGTGNGTQRIVSGQQVTVDGDAGTVTLAV
ncbi:PEP/pyruvate-binding domain-containing protein [Arthrobacter sp. MA-N2]|uniref:PEP/pyruvate-binding domain-containing protein n=1 Tax=Arthrobacter sp. MA-N2 TaxID=1101188 RepID=UPI000485A279|nr:PEP/pyruvate-binding domain-containing protein [Arthrobacter sp. MA-N2]